MALLKFDLNVEYEDGQTESVTSDQRDHAIWEVQKFGCTTQNAFEERPAMFFRWSAWHALKRTNRTTDSWEIWNARVIEVLPPADDDEEAGDVVPNPGNSAAHDEG